MQVFLNNWTIWLYDFIISDMRYGKLNYTSDLFWDKKRL